MTHRPLYRTALAAVLLALLPPGAPTLAQPDAHVVDMDGGLILASDGRVYARKVAAFDEPVRWTYLASVPLESPPVAITHLTSTPNHYFLVVAEDGDVYRFEGLNRNIERTGNVFGKVASSSVKPKTIGGEKVQGTSKPGSR